MKNLINLFILLSLFCGCANPHVVDAVDRSIGETPVSHKVSILFEDPDDYRAYIRNMIAEEIDRFPQVNTYVAGVIVRKNDGKFEHSGQYITDTKIILILNGDILGMKETLWHELCHAMQDQMSPDEIHAWCEIAALRLEQVGLDDFAKDKWETVKIPSGVFPRQYAIKNIWEFMSVHFEYYMGFPEYSNIFKEEYALIIKMGWAPKDGRLAKDAIIERLQ